MCMIFCFHNWKNLPQSTPNKGVKNYMIFHWMSKILSRSGSVKYRPGNIVFFLQPPFSNVLASSYLKMPTLLCDSEFSADGIYFARKDLKSSTVGLK